MVDLNTDTFESLLDNFIKTRGVEKTITLIIFPFLVRIGILWVTNHINPAQEHLVSNIIRQKIIAGIENAVPLLRVNKTVLLFLPEGEHHELALLYMFYTFRIRGIKVLYVGANVPMEDLEFVVKLKSPDILFTHITSITQNFSFEKFIGKMSVRFPGQAIVVSGHFSQQYKKKVPQNICLKRSLAEVMEFVATIS
jgi:hypothetical protein